MRSSMPGVLPACSCRHPSSLRFSLTWTPEKRDCFDRRISRCCCLQRLALAALGRSWAPPWATWQQPLTRQTTRAMEMAW
ncbi:unnamed protein product [Symbiodinium pilosum]|uniref:Uncharacterized protein n=1 Tax=Symbiodinium pilosum TaxID=2952 RepID=A0A812T306_SYMPI|nr:unnamed protein product [Symbiodinium pilosum]